MSKMTLDEVFISTSLLTTIVTDTLQRNMSEFGFIILNVLITNVAPNAAIRAAINNVHASRRRKEAAVHVGDAEKIVKIKRAEAACEATYLSGVGLAAKRKAIMEGFKYVDVVLIYRCSRI